MVVIYVVEKKVEKSIIKRRELTGKEWTIIIWIITMLIIYGIVNATQEVTNII